MRDYEPDTGPADGAQYDDFYAERTGPSPSRPAAGHSHTCSRCGHTGRDVADFMRIGGRVYCLHPWQCDRRLAASSAGQ